MNENPGGGGNQPTVTLDVDAQVFPLEEGKGNLLAFANLTLGGCLVVKDVRVMNSENGPFVAMPSILGKDQKYHKICRPVTEQLRQDISDVVLDRYQYALAQSQTMEQPVSSEKKAARPDATMSVDVTICPLPYNKKAPMSRPRTEKSA